MDENLIPSASTGESKELYQIYVDRIAQKTSEIPKLQLVDVPVVLVTQFPRVQVVEEAVESDVANMKFDAGVDDDPFVKVKDLAEASSETNQKSHCEEERSKVTKKKEDLEADVAKALITT